MWAKWTISPTSCHLTHWPYWKKQASVWSLFVSSWPHWQLRGNYDFAPLQEKFLALSFFSSWASSFQHHCAQAKSKNFSVQCEWKIFLGSLHCNVINNIVLYIMGPSSRLDWNFLSQPSQENVFLSFNHVRGRLAKLMQRKHKLLLFHFLPPMLWYFCSILIAWQVWFQEICFGQTVSIHRGKGPVLLPLSELYYSTKYTVQKKSKIPQIPLIYSRFCSPLWCSTSSRCYSCKVSAFSIVISFWG